VDKQELLKVIEKAKRDKKTSLNLGGDQLSELPEQIGQLTNLKTLDLSHNNFDIPLEVHEMEPADKINYILQKQNEAKES